jgi:cytochrome c-type biogenesis protein CcmH
VIAFVAIAAGLVAVALAWVLMPLLRRRAAVQAIAQEASNLAVLRHQLAELDADRAAGTLSEEQYRQARAEIEKRVLDEARATPAAPAVTARPSRWTAVALGVTLPVLATLLYLQLGRFDSFAPQRPSAEQSVTREQVEAMVAQLAARLQQQPNDPQGWRMLARSYFVMQRFPEAATAYAKLVDLVPDDADALADYANALAMAQGQQLAGRPMELVQKALKLNPNQWKALALAGAEAFERKDYRSAVTYWERLRQAIPPDSEIARSIGQNIAEARQLAGMNDSPPLAAASVKGTVRLSPELTAKASPSDTVFIFARAVNGPKMPLAVVKRQVKDLPTAFTLDDSQAMAPNMKLSSFREIVVAARVSRSADAMPRSGDLQGQSVPVAVGAANVVVVIDGVVP